MEREEEREKRTESSGLVTKMQFEDLSQDCLMEVLERLSPPNLLKMARVNKKLNKLVDVKLRVKIKMIVVEGKETINSRRDRNDIVHLKDPEKDMFLKILARVASIKSIDFGAQELTNEVLQEVVKCCPEIHCFIIKRSVVDEDAWNNFFSQIGHQIVHFTWYQLEDNPTSPARLFEMIAMKCFKIEVVKFCFQTLTSDLISSLKKLPKSCYVEIDAQSVLQSFDDTINSLVAKTIDWSVFGCRIQRLVKLKLSFIENADESHFGCQFDSLNELAFHSPKLKIQAEFSFLASCRFPRLEKFQMRPTSDLTEDHYYNLFKNMPVLKRFQVGYMAFHFDEDIEDEGVLPRAAILQLKKLEQIMVIIFSNSPNWQPTNVIQQLEWYVDEIPTLKSLVVTDSGDSNLKSLIDEGMQPIKCKQNRVEIITNF